MCKKNGGAPAPSKRGRRKSKRDSPASGSDEEFKKPRGRSSSRSPIPAQRVSDRNAKRKRSVYTEDNLEDTDTDDLMSSGEEERLEKRREKRIARKKRKEAESGGEDVSNTDDAVLTGEGEEVEEEHVPFYEIESPPDGQLNCLWYSREPFRHVFVLEKVLGWKTRPVVKLEVCEPNKAEGEETKPPSLLGRGKLHTIDFDESLKMKEKTIVEAGNDFRKRREISQINPRSCPYIKQFASDQELARSKKEGSEPKFKAVKSTKDREEVFLVKWRGRSYMHW